MSRLYARIFVKILDSSIAEDWQVRHVFEDLLKLASQDGVVDITHSAISRRINVPLEIVERAIISLEAPDASSRDPEEGGRRIVRLDAHRTWGWRIVNFDRYEEIRSNQDIRDYERQRKAESRSRSKANEGGAAKEPPSLFTPIQEKDIDVDVESTRTSPGQNGHVRDTKTFRPAVAGPAAIDSEFLESLRKDPAYAGIDIDRELGKCRRWCEVHRKMASRRRFVAWINRAERPIVDLDANARRPIASIRSDFTSISRWPTANPDREAKLNALRDEARLEHGVML